MLFLLLHSIRKKREASSVEGDGLGPLLPADAIPPVEEPLIPGPEGHHANTTWPTPSGITLDMATSSCMAPIQSLSTYNSCAEITAEKMQPIIDACTLDILVRYRSPPRKQAPKHNDSTLRCTFKNVKLSLTTVNGV